MLYQVHPSHKVQDCVQMKFNIGAENSFLLADEDCCLQVEPHLLFQPAPEALNNRIVDTFDEPAYRVNLRVNIPRKSVAKIVSKHNILKGAFRQTKGHLGLCIAIQFRTPCPLSFGSG